MSIRVAILGGFQLYLGVSVMNTGKSGKLVMLLGLDFGGGGAAAPPPPPGSAAYDDVA